MKMRIASLLFMLLSVCTYGQVISTDGTSSWVKLQPPYITYPPTGTAINALALFTITSSAFNANIPGQSHISTDWQVTTGPKGSGTVTYQSIANTISKTSLPVIALTLTAGQTYYVRIKYHSTDYDSVYSDDILITT